MGWTAKCAVCRVPMEKPRVHYGGREGGEVERKGGREKGREKVWGEGEREGRKGERKGGGGKGEKGRRKRGRRKEERGEIVGKSKVKVVEVKI